METNKSVAAAPPDATIVFSTVGRTVYGFDIFCVNLNLISINKQQQPPPCSDWEQRLTDGISINYNAQFDDHYSPNSIVFISERTGSPRIYHQQQQQQLPTSSIDMQIQQQQPKLLPSAPGSLFHDRPILSKQGHLYFVSAHQHPHSLYKSWSAVYTIPYPIPGSALHNVTRLSPVDVVDYSPAISHSANLIAVASYGSKPWDPSDFHRLSTQIVVFPLSNPTQRTVVANQGGWPSWCGDSTIYFHHQSQDDGWWSIYRVDLDASNSSPPSPLRITPPGVHAFTPAAMQDGKRIAVATRRKETPFRHIEIFHLDSGEFEPITQLVNPEMHHYNPFVSQDSKFLGYHRFRGESVQPPAQRFVPNLEPVDSPVTSLKMLRINGNFPCFSPDGKFIAYNHNFDTNGKGGLNLMTSDGSMRWNLIKGRLAFHTIWCPTPDSINNKSVIFTSLGGIFQPAHATVQIARVTFDPSKLHPNGPDDVEVKILTKVETGNNAFPACSPDGKYLVFRSGRSGHKNLYIMDAVNGEVEGGSNIRQLTQGEWIDTMPSWSPDGQLIAFSSNRHNPTNALTFGIYMVRPDGSGLRRVHAEGSTEKEEMEMERINHVCFSPNGEWLLFTANIGGVTAEPISLPNQFQPYGDLFMIRLDGSGLTRLTWNAYENGTPTWHPHSHHFDIQRLSLHGNGKGEDIPLHLYHDELKNGLFQEPLWIN